MQTDRNLKNTMKPIRPFGLWLPRLLMGALPAVALGEPAGLTVARDGRPTVVIVTADQPTAAVTRNAAQEMVYHLKKATGVGGPIVIEDAVYHPVQTCPERFPSTGRSRCGNRPTAPARP